jgi:hypothetical protein
MGSETRSLWEQLDSDVEPWRRGRAFLISFSLLQLLIQLFLLMVTAFAISIEVTAVAALSCVIFWFLFYFVWIGIHWVRWLWGLWDLVTGFCLLVWGLRDTNSFQLLFGGLSFVIGFMLCLSPSIYFFAVRQRESVRWFEASLMGGACLLLMAAIIVSLVLFIGVREGWRRDAAAFATEVNLHAYQDNDADWFAGRVTADALQRNGPEGMKSFCWANRLELGRIETFDPPKSRVMIRLTWPIDLTATAWVDCRAPARRRDIEIHEILVGQRGDWRIYRMWWDTIQ